jgi:hypothetical protein
MLSLRVVVHHGLSTEFVEHNRPGNDSEVPRDPLADEEVLD